MRQRLAIVAPLDESELSFGALWARELTPHLSKEFDIELFTDDAGLLSPIVAGHPANHFLRLFEEDQCGPFSAVLTFMEDSPRSLFVRFAMVGAQALCIAVDANLERMFAGSPWEFDDPKEIPLIVQTLAPAFAIGVTNTQAFGTIQHYLPKKNLFGTSHPIAPPTSEELGLRAHREPHGPFRVAYAGRYFVEDRAQILLDAVLSLSAEGKRIALDWICPVSAAKGIRDFLALSAERRNIDLTDLVSVRPVSSFAGEREALCEADAFVYLRGDLLRSPPPALFHALALGLPTAVLDFGPAGELPDQIVVKIPAGTGEAAALRVAITELGASSDLRRAYCSAVMKYMSELHSPAAVLSDLRVVIEHYARERDAAADQSRHSLTKLALTDIEGVLWD